MSKQQRFEKEIDKILTAPSTVTEKEIAEYQEDVEAYYVESYELASETC